MVLKKNLLPIILIIIVILLGIVAVALLFSGNKLQKEHEAEIKRVIAAKGGEVIEVERVSPESSPFVGDYNKSNIVYRVVFTKGSNQLTAWYRGVNVVNDIHARNPTALQGGYEEKWIIPTEGH